MTLSRRNFLHTAIAGSLTLGLQAQEPESKHPAMQSRAGKRPIIISSANGYGHLEEAYVFLTGGGDTLDAAVRVVKAVEDDPSQDAVGLSGLPNEEGVVELDASCMHGPTRRAGSVASVRNIKNPCLLAKAVMEKTGHVMLVAEGAERFALAQGFPRETVGLTEHARKIWLLYKETHSDWWGPGLADPNWKKRLLRGEPHSEEWQFRMDNMEQVAAGIGIAPEERMAAIRKVLFPPMGTSHCSALSGSGEMSGCTTTSGLAWKIPGRVGDSPIIGAGCYTDQDVGSAGATGSGEENIKVAGAHTIIENMRHGMSPLDAGMDALRRIVRNYNGDKERLQFMDMVYFVLRKDGAYAGVSLWTNRESEEPHTIAVHDGTRRLENTVGLFSGAPRNWPPKPAA
jgi:N4-(beta-N-acetylglucosaminyl)-L-asparaginase